MRKLVYLIIIATGIYVAYTRFRNFDPKNVDIHNFKAGNLSRIFSPNAPNDAGVDDATPAPRKAGPAMSPYYATSAEATQEALVRYPALGTVGTDFNKEYVSRYNAYKQKQPDYFKENAWPEHLADEVAQVVHVQPVVIQHFAVALAAAKSAQPMAIHPGDAFSLAQLEEAKEKARRERKPLGFIMCWGQFFDQSCDPRWGGSNPAFIHFFQAFHKDLVLVFVRHESELGNVPPAVNKGFSGPDEGGFAPNMAVVDASANEFIVEIPMGGGGSTGVQRDEVFATGTAKIDQWLATHPGAIGTAAQ